MAKKPKGNLFSGGILSNTLAATTTDQQQEGPQITPNQPIVPPVAEDEDDPLFGSTKRIEQITKQVEAITDTNTVPKIAIDLLEDNPYQPRKRMNEAQLDALSNEIKDYGFKGVLVARQHPEKHGKYQLVFGHRRREAAKRAELTELPVIIDNTISDKEMKAVAVTENILREDLTPLDEAYAFAAWLEEMSQDAIAKRLGVSRGYIRNRLDILKAPEDVQDMVEEHPNTMKAVTYLKDIPEEDIRRTVIQALTQEEITINQIKVFIENLRKASSALVTPILTVTTLNTYEVSEPGFDPESDTVLLAYSQEDVQEKEKEITAHNPKPIAAENNVSPKLDLIKQSKEQTEALVNVTKIETFIKYVQKCGQQWQRRSVTTDELRALESLIEAAKRIYDSHH
jgi:ParB family chromosome partitioning protein